MDASNDLAVRGFRPATLKTYLRDPLRSTWTVSCGKPFSPIRFFRPVGYKETPGGGRGRRVEGELALDRPESTVPLVLAAAAVLLVSLVAYADNWNHGFVFDDEQLVVRNERIRSLDRAGELFRTPYWGPERNDGLYRPLTLLSYAVDYRLFGDDPRGYHVVNDLLHAVISVLVLLLARRMLGSWLAGAAAGLTFALHPVHTEAVNWVVGRAELLAALFVLLALLLALWPEPLDARRHRGRTVAVVLLGLLGLLSKEHAIVLTLALPGALLAVERGGGTSTAGARGVWRRLGGLAAGWAVMLGAWWILRSRAVGTETLPTGFYDNQLVVAGAADRVWTALSVFTLWLEQLALPFRFSVDYAWPKLPTLQSPLHARVLLALVLLPGLAVLAVALWRRGGRLRVVGFWVGFLLVAWVPTSNLLLTIGTLFGERLLYLPSVAWCIVLGWVIGRLPGRAPAWTVLMAIGLAFGALTWERTLDWKDNLTLFEHEHRNRPASARALRNYASSLEPRDPAAADASYREVVERFPDYLDGRQAYGTFLFKQGRHAAAVEHLAAADRLRPDDPTTLLNLGAAHASLEQWDRAAECWRRVLELQPDHEKARLNLERLERVRSAPE